MKEYYKKDEWCIIEEGFNPEMQKASESIFSLGNGMMGQRANFEERYSGESLQGTYVAGVYYPDKTRVGWWKNGYPEYFAKVLNAPSWIGIDVQVDDEELNLATCEVSDFVRTLDMQHATLGRSFVATLKGGKKVKVEALRFLSIVNDEIAAIRYQVTPLNFSGKIAMVSYLDGDVYNQDSNYDEQFWTIDSKVAEDGYAQLIARTKKLDFVVAMSTNFELSRGENRIFSDEKHIKKDKQVGSKVFTFAQSGEVVSLYKYVSVLNSQNYHVDELGKAGRKAVNKAYTKGFDKLLKEHAKAWEEKWEHGDIIIEGDVVAQQGIRFNIFHLNQTYTGKDERLNVGPKGFTGEKYGGTTYWDTEAFVLPFFLSSAKIEVSRNFLVYRHNHLQRAIENAAKLGFKDGAALYPMVTINGEECHNEWEITFEEIHRNGAIAFAIYNYIRYTGDWDYIYEYGLEVLIGISRFWAQRVNWSEDKQAYVMLGVTGPNEYENNINNNWYTNKMAQWTLQYTLEQIQLVKSKMPQEWSRIAEITKFDVDTEMAKMEDVEKNIFFPTLQDGKLFLQQDGYMDKPQILAEDLDPAERPINQNWSWDRILRSCFLKQADVLQGMATFEDQYTDEEIALNFDFYEPRTLHESSLSPCVHTILGVKLGKMEKAYEMYLRTSRLDLDDYNKEVADGLHITSMGGTWMSVVYGFGGLRIKDDKLSFDPAVPKQWKSVAFKIMFRGHSLTLKMWEDKMEISNLQGGDLELLIKGKAVLVAAGATLVL
ncbi:MAG: family 65 glycosyl hydrolase domain-containing protein [Bacteroidales bacterium]|jgi:maltose phosphorylase|nr:family 65 glycosyl hydrolase domain-containing protein [Bacteroidales bacterium]